MLPTTPARATHDYQRNGTCDLFAALEIATGKVITDIRPRHTSADFVAFLNKVNREVPAEPRRPRHLGQPVHPQDPRPCTSGCCATAASTSTSPPPTGRG